MKTKELCTNGKRLLAVALAIGVIGAAHAFQPAPAALPSAQLSAMLNVMRAPGKCRPYDLSHHCDPSPSLLPPIMPSPPLPGRGPARAPIWLLSL